MVGPRPHILLLVILSALSLSMSSLLASSLDLRNTGHAPGLHSFTNGRGVYKHMAREFLDAHNAIRAKYGVAPLRWDPRLARYARRWSVQRHFDCILQHSNTPDYGENVFQGSGWDWRAADAVEKWAGEEKFYNWASNTCKAGEMCGHFTQLVWNSTTSVGCGRAECVAGGVFITCSYYPPGNWIGERPLSRTTS